MADDPQKKDYRDRDRVAGDQEHEVRYFAEKNKISEDQVHDLIKKHGNMRADLEREARTLRS